MARTAIVGVCPRCGHPVRWQWSGNNAKTSSPCDCCGYRGCVRLSQVPMDHVREKVRDMHERAMRGWKRGKRKPTRLLFGVGAGNNKETKE